MIEFGIFTFALGLGIGWLASENSRIDRDFWQQYALRLEKISIHYFKIINKKR